MVRLELRDKELALLEQLLHKRVSELSQRVFNHECKTSDLSSYTLASYLLEYIAHEKVNSL